MNKHEVEGWEHGLKFKFGKLDESVLVGGLKYQTEESGFQSTWNGEPERVVEREVISSAYGNSNSDYEGWTVSGHPGGGCYRGGGP